ncbi:MAG: hypothetical protein ACTSRE_00835 [Promethearchaeota archaeon]
MPINLGQWIVFFTFIMLFLVFIFFDVFKRDEPYGNIAYIAAVIPSIYMWHLVTLPANLSSYSGWGATGAWVVLTGLWSIAMIRDIILVMQKHKDIDDVALWLGVAFIIMLVASAILPIDVLMDHLQNTSNQVMGFLYMPDVHYAAHSTTLLLLQSLSTFIVLGLIVPMIRDFRGQPVNMFALLIVTILISAPFALISFLWLPQFWYALLSAFAVLFFIMMLLLTRGGNQHKKIRPPIKKPSTRPKPEQKKEEENKPEEE